MCSSRAAPPISIPPAGSLLEEKFQVSVRTDAADLADSANVTRLAAQFPHVDILVNNAGAIPGGTLFDVDEAQWRTAWDLKVLGTINLTRAFYPLMKVRGGGVIINVIGNAARSHDPEYICGVTGNAGLAAFTELLGSGSVRDGIRVIGVSPGTDRDRPGGRARGQAGAGAVRRSVALARAVPIPAARRCRSAGRDRRHGRLPGVAALRQHQRRGNHARCRRLVAGGIDLKFHLSGRRHAMPLLTTDDGVKLHYEEVGSGAPVIFVHEFAGDWRSWEPQLRHFGRRYRCIAYNARGFTPSDVPDDVEKYSQDRARDDIKAVMDALRIDKAHIVGLSMGGFATLHFGFTYPERVLSLVIGGCGYGASADKRAQFAEETEAAARRFEEVGMSKAAMGYALAPSRVQFQNKDPRGWQEFADQLAGNSTRGAALTMRGVQKRRPSLFDLVDRMKTITTPTLIMTGDEDWPCLEPALLMKRTISTAGLVVMPNTGHTINLEEPGAFNQHVADFLHAVEAGRWPSRDPRAMISAILGK